LEEIEYINDGKVIVTSTRAISNGHTYSLSKVASVSMGVLKNAMMGCAKWLKLVGGIFTIFMGLITIRDSIGLVFLVFGTILIGFVYFYISQLKKIMCL
jgi:hypothetical protein